MQPNLRQRTPEPWSYRNIGKRESSTVTLNPNADNPEDASLAAEHQRTIAELAELAGGLAHELRNPLSTMMINLKLLAETLRDTSAQVEDVRRRALLKVDVLRREAERLQCLFDEFLNLTGPCRLQRERIDLNAIVTRLANFFEPLATSAGLVLEVVGTDGPLPCVVDEKLLSQALLNVVVNAQEAMPEGGRLRITLEQDGGEAVISVSDTGVGIAEKDRERLLRPFFSTKAGGTGLGLSVTQRLIREHGGTLDFESKLGVGTTFRIRLPRNAARAGSSGSAG